MRRDAFQDADTGLATGSSTVHYYLIVVSGGPSGQMIRLDPCGVRIGRASENTVIWTEASISRHHACLHLDESGQVWLNDLGSTNGTFRNGDHVPRDTPTLLTNGDLLRFGLAMEVKFAGLTPIEEKFHQELYERAVRDSLTGLMNRASFLGELPRLVGQGASQGLGLSVVMIDIDHFKQVNDTYGHDVGDAVLRAVATTLLQSLRPGDLVARYGGEEFIAALMVPTLEQGRQAAERIRQNLGHCEIRAAGVPLRITGSLGVAFAGPGDSRTLDALITTADGLLYEAKHAGRDRVVIETGPRVDEGPGQSPNPSETTGP